MPSIDELNRRFSIPNVARFTPGRGDLPRLAIAGPAGRGVIYLHGAHITQFQPTGRENVLFLSSRSNYQDGTPIRGGVPIIFPWFGPRADDATAPMHGLVRTREWQVESVTETSDGIRAVMTLSSNDQTRAAWPHDFLLRFSTTFAAVLTMELEVTNTSGQSFTFDEALHTYFSVADVRSITIDGLGGAEYLDKEQGNGRFRQQEGQLKITGVTDRVYVNTPATCTIDDAGNRRRIIIAKEHSASTVVWNPWTEKIKTMADLDPADWTKYLCIETCNVKENALTLAPGQSHTMRATISIA
jgi:glucose-6-phosphate 1-epimerase